MKIIMLILALVTTLNLFTPLTAHAAYSTTTIKEAQAIMNKFGIPAGPVDGSQGPMTRRGLCIFRYMSGLSVNRNLLDSTTLSKLRSYNSAYSSITKIPTKYTSSAQEKLVAHETCQAMTLSRKTSSTTNSHKFWRVMAISTGINEKECKSGSGTLVTCNTPNGTYWLGRTSLGWTCSSLYPETCKKQTTGKYLAYGSYGNMYNFRSFHGGYGIHGSTSVPTYPASHGCIRVPVSDSDWMYANVGNGWITPSITVVGSYY